MRVIGQSTHASLILAIRLIRIFLQSMIVFNGIGAGFCGVNCTGRMLRRCIDGVQFQLFITGSFDKVSRLRVCATRVRLTIISYKLCTRSEKAI
jgi:hypothetical protein